MTKSLKLYFAVGIGGMIGATSRYGISILIGFHGGFPTTTLVVNLLGCFVLSYLLNSEFLMRLFSPILLIAIGTGMIGSFTTFSTVTVEVVELFYVNIWLALLYVLMSIIGGLAFCYAGYKFAVRNQVRV